MLNLPFINFIPKFFKRDTKLIAYADKMDDIIEGLRDDTLGLNTFIDPYRCPAVILDELGYYLSADLNSTDSERQKRIKIATAVKGHKNRSTFNDDIKIKIDIVAGGDSQILHATDSDDWILGGDGITIPSAYYWATMGCDGIDDDLGLSLIGEGIEIEVAGNIYIDVDNNSLSASEIQQIVDNITNAVPAYLRVFIGYIDGTGAFIVYTYIN